MDKNWILGFEIVDWVYKCVFCLEKWQIPTKIKRMGEWVCRGRWVTFCNFGATNISCSLKNFSYSINLLSRSLIFTGQSLLVVQIHDCLLTKTIVALSCIVSDCPIVS